MGQHGGSEDKRVYDCCPGIGVGVGGLVLGNSAVSGHCHPPWKRSMALVALRLKSCLI